MTITKNKEGGRLTIALEGRLDTTTAPDLDKELKAEIGGVTDLVFDLSDLAYVSSAGLRVFLSAQKIMLKQGTMVLRGVDPDIMEVLELTGFSDILTIE